MPLHYYHNDNLWVEFDEGDEIITIGITDKASDKLDSIEQIDLPSEGDDFDKGDVICEIEGANGNILVTAPAAGFISEVNSAVADDPSTITDSPLEEGWLVKIEIQDPTDLKEYEE